MLLLVDKSSLQLLNTYTSYDLSTINPKEIEKNLIKAEISDPIIKSAMQWIKNAQVLQFSNQQESEINKDPSYVFDAQDFVETQVFGVHFPPDLSLHRLEKVNNFPNNVNFIIKNELLGKDVSLQEDVDNLMIELDGTKNKSNLGANAILGVSLAVLNLGAKTLGLPLFHYINQVFYNINGDAHALCSFEACTSLIVCLWSGVLR